MTPTMMRCVREHRGLRPWLIFAQCSWLRFENPNTGHPFSVCRQGCFMTPTLLEATELTCPLSSGSVTENRPVPCPPSPSMVPQGA